MSANHHEFLLLDEIFTQLEVFGCHSYRVAEMFDVLQDPSGGHASSSDYIDVLREISRLYDQCEDDTARIYLRLLELHLCRLVRVTRRS